MPRKILIVDDEPDIRMYLEAALEDHDFEAHGIDQQAPFLATVAEEQPALICLDIMMPERSGITLYRKLQEDDSFRKIPIVLITGMTEAADILAEAEQELSQSGAPPYGVIEKPVKIPELVAMIETLLGRSQAG